LGPGSGPDLSTARKRIRFGGQHAQANHDERRVAAGEPPRTSALSDRRCSGFEQKQCVPSSARPASTAFSVVRSTRSANRLSPVASSNRQASMTLPMAAQVSA
jgi:hypothetical protein